MSKSDTMWSELFAMFFVVVFYNKHHINTEAQNMDVSLASNTIRHNIKPTEVKNILL